MYLTRHAFNREPSAAKANNPFVAVENTAWSPYCVTAILAPCILGCAHAGTAPFVDKFALELRYSGKDVHEELGGWI